MSHFSALAVLTRDGAEPAAGSGIHSDGEWAEFLVDSHRDPGEAIVVAARETKLSPQQRADVKHWHECFGTPAVLVTDSIVTRGVATAMSWFCVKIRRSRGETSIGLSSPRESPRTSAPMRRP